MKTVLLVLLLGLLVQDSLSFRLPLKARETRKLTTSMGRLLEKRANGPKLGASYHIPLKVQPPLLSTSFDKGNLTYWGEFFTVVGLGSPAQLVPLQVDTGSADLIVYSKNCDGCNSTATYDAWSSTSAQTIYCDDGDYNCYTPDNDCDGTDQCAWEDQYVFWLVSVNYPLHLLHILPLYFCILVFAPN
jgi:hypothetical protein